MNKGYIVDINNFKLTPASVVFVERQRSKYPLNAIVTKRNNKFKNIPHSIIP
jgi:hypothetical protein